MLKTLLLVKGNVSELDGSFIIDLIEPGILFDQNILLLDITIVSIRDNRV